MSGTTSTCCRGTANRDEANAAVAVALATKRGTNDKIFAFILARNGGGSSTVGSIFDCGSVYDSKTAEYDLDRRFDINQNNLSSLLENKKEGSHPIRIHSKKWIFEKERWNA